MRHFAMVPPDVLYRAYTVCGPSLSELRSVYAAEKLLNWQVIGGEVSLMHPVSLLGLPGLVTSKSIDLLFVKLKFELPVS
jgi:hypothetical protein